MDLDQTIDPSIVANLNTALRRLRKSHRVRWDLIHSRQCNDSSVTKFKSCLRPSNDLYRGIQRVDDFLALFVSKERK